MAAKQPVGESPATIQIVVPAYGTSPLLTETLDSLAQHVPADVALAVLDDASPGDHVLRQAEPFAPRISYWRNERNLGVSGAFNAAMRRAEADYVILVGPDDRALPGMLAAYREAAALFPGVAALHPGVPTIDEHGRRWTSTGDRVKAVIRPRAPRALSGQGMASRLLVGNWTYNPAIAWRRSFVLEQPFNERLHTAMDLELLLRLAFGGETLGLVDAPAIEYRRHAGAVSSINAGRKRLREELDIHGWAREEARRRGWRRAAAAARLAPSARLHGLLLAGGSKNTERTSTLRLVLSDAKAAPRVE